MWKSIVLCVSLFGSAALGLALGARFVEPAALPAVIAIGLCIIGVVLILAAPTVEAQELEQELGQLPGPAPGQEEATPRLAEHPLPTVAVPVAPFEALNS